MQVFQKELVKFAETEVRAAGKAAAAPLREKGYGKRHAASAACM